MKPHSYYTREQLYALCVLLLWAQPMSLSANKEMQNTVTLHGVADGNAGLSLFLLQKQTTATNVRIHPEDAKKPLSVIYPRYFFDVLGVTLIVQFDEDGVGVVTFAQNNEPF